MDIRIWFVLLSLGIVLGAYLFLSKREGNYINVLFPYVLINVPSLFLLDLVFLAVFGGTGSAYAYFYCYATYAVSILALVIAYLAVPDSWVPVLIEMPRLRLRGLYWGILFAGFALYAPILVMHADLISSPREIYSATRTSFGIQFFLSTFLGYLALILMCFEKTKSKIMVGTFMLLLCVFLYLHGSKGQLIYAFLIWLCYGVFVRRWKFRFKSLIGLGGAAAGVIVLLFYLTFPATMKTDLLLNIAKYSDYTRNAALVIDDRSLEPQLGRLTVESSVYTMVPRVLFPEKPRNFGPLWLAERYFPESFAANTGAPAFGLGLRYADFKQLAIAWEVLSHLLLGCALKILVVRLRTRPDPGTFILLLVLMDIALIPTGSVVPLAFYYLAAHLANTLSGGRDTAVGRGPVPMKTAGQQA